MATGSLTPSAFKCASTCTVRLLPTAPHAAALHRCGTNIEGRSSEPDLEAILIMTNDRKQSAPLSE